MLPVAGKTLHIYHSMWEEHTNCANETHHNCSDCPICQFTFSTFTSSSAIECDYSIVAIHYKYVIPYCDLIYQRLNLPYGLRASPAMQPSTLPIC